MRLYRDGLELLRRTVQGGALNHSLGWDRIGPPHAAVPPTDHVWYRRRGHTHLVDEGDWGFVGGEVDQGFMCAVLA